MNACLLQPRMTVFLLLLLLAGTGHSQPAGRVRISVDATQSAGKLEPFWASQIIHPTESLLTDTGRDFFRSGRRCAPISRGVWRTPS
jgi:hypothetical protein